VKNLLGVEGYTEFQTDFRKYFEEMRKKWIDVKESEIAEYYSVEVSSKFKHLLKKHKQGKVVSLKCFIRTVKRF
jgi:ERCC4-related helicase